MLSKKVKLMIMSYGILAGSISPVFMRPVEVHAETSLTQEQINNSIQEKVSGGYASVNNYSKTTLTPMVTIPSDATNVYMSTGDRNMFYKGTDISMSANLDEYNSEGVLEKSYSIFSDRRSADYQADMTFEGINKRPLKPGYSYQLKLNLSGGTATLTYGSVYYYYIPGVPTLIEKINGLAESNLDSQNKITTLQSKILGTQPYVTALDDGEEKDSFQSSLDLAQEVVNLSQARLDVANTESSYLLSDLDKARKSVNALPEGEDKDELILRVNEIDGLITIKNTEIATESVVLAEENRKEADIINARNLVSILPEGNDKNSLNKRLDILQGELLAPVDFDAPNRPLITYSGNKITITTADNGSKGTGFGTSFDDFETDKFENALTGDWARATKKVKSGSFSLASTNYLKKSSTSSQTLTFVVPTGEVGRVSFDYLVSSSYSDTFKATLNGTTLVSGSGDNRTWKSFAKENLAPGNYILTFEYNKGSGDSYYDDTAYIDNLSINSNKEVTHLPSGIQAIQYKIDEGTWQRYTGAFTPNVSGDVMITARALDYAGNISTSATQMFYIEGDVPQELDEEQQAIEEATNIVEIAESTKLQSDVDLARALVNLINRAEEKQALNSRLDIVQNYILINEISERLNRIIELLNSQSLSKEEVANAEEELLDLKELVNSLPNSAEKEELLNQAETTQENLEKISQEKEEVQAIEEATNSVNNAENSKSQEDIDSARELVNALPDGETKTELENKLDELQNAIDEELAKEQEELAKEQELLEAIENATNSVNNAESSKSQEDINSAKELVNALPDGEVKTELQDRLDEVQNSIDEELANAEEEAKEQEMLEAIEDATNMVEIAESTKSQEDINNAEELVNTLPEGEAKTELQDRLDELQNSIDEEAPVLNLKAVETAVGYAEKFISQSYVSKAEELVNALPDCPEKDSFIERLDKVKSEIDKNELAKLIKNAETQLKLAESLKREPYITKAINAINLLPNCPEKDNFIERVNKLTDNKVVSGNSKAEIDMATNYVTQAEVNNSKYFYDKALGLVNNLKDSSEKTALQERLDILNEKLNPSEETVAIKSATYYVEIAEKYGYDYYIKKANKLVNDLADSSEKTALLVRVNNL